LGIFAQEERNQRLIEAVQSLVEALWDAGNEDGAHETLSLGRSALFWTDDGLPFASDFLSLAEIYAYIGDSAGAKEVLGLALDRSFQWDVSDLDLRLLLSAASLMRGL
ncbi:MAG: hypothetical protein AAFX92_21130, partial [Pseudomonadota bacterium]